MDSAANLKKDYHIGIITALPIERAAITAMLDVEYDKPDDFDQSFHDPNSYTWGRMGKHNVVITSLAAGVYGNTMATTTAMPMLYSFTNIKFGLMVGIGAGVPTSQDVRLGDVVVSQPSGISGGVFQYDLGKAKHNEWERKDFLARPPDILLKALNKLQTEHEFRIPRAYEHLRTAITKHEYWGHFYGRPSVDDRLFPSSYLHHVDSFGDACSVCDPVKAIKRTLRPSIMDFKIHYGVIASGNSLVKDAELRDWIASMEKQCLCIEMEAAGLMNSFPCLVIRGICDYADSHKNDAWQRYACATAAALSKELLSFVPLTDSKVATKATEVLQGTNLETSNSPFHVRDGLQQEDRNSSLSGLPSSDSIRSQPLTNTIPMQDSAFSHRSPDNLSAPTSTVAELESIESRIFSRYPSLKEGNFHAKRGEWDNTVLHLAARDGDTEVVEWLLQRDVNTEARNKLGFTPLLLAAWKGHLDTVRLLIKHKANIEPPHKDGDTPLYASAEKGHLEMVRLLIKQKANIEAAYRYGETPLWIAARNGHLDVARLLIEHKANIEAADQEGYTPLYVAVDNGHFEVANILLENGANFRFAPSGKSISDAAKQNGHKLPR